MRTSLSVGHAPGIYHDSAQADTIAWDIRTDNRCHYAFFRATNRTLDRAGRADEPAGACVKQGNGMAHYMNWAKVHEPARYELTESGVPRVRPAEFDAARVPVSLEVKGPYGDPALIETIATRYAVSPRQVLPVPGASSANFIALTVSARHGEPVVMERPAYDPFERIASFLGLRIVPLQRRSDEGFAVRIDAVEASLQRGARAVVLTNLHNPSGQYLTLDAIGEVAQACARADATLIVDEVYLDGVFLTGRSDRWTAAGIAPNVVVTSSLTKVYGLGGLRAGWLIGNTEVIERARDVVDLLHVVDAAPATALAIHAFSKLSSLEARYRRVYENGQAVFRSWLKNEPLVRGYESHGALFECLALCDGVDADGFSEYLVTEYDTQVVSGRFFGLDGHIRISIAPPGGNLADGLARISAALRTYTSRS